MKNNKIKKINKIFPIIFTSIFFPIYCSKAKALMDYTSEACRKSGNCELNDFVRLFVGVYKIIFGIIGSVTLLMIIFGGVTFLISGGNPEKIAKGKKIILNAFIGLAIVFFSYMIITYIINNLGYLPANNNIING
jgi:hypothetical protein